MGVQYRRMIIKRVVAVLVYWFMIGRLKRLNMEIKHVVGLGILKNEDLSIVRKVKVLIY